MSYNYYLIDAFTRQPFQGAQVAVFPDSGDMDTQCMQLIARELNLSETVFIQPADDPSEQAYFRVFSPLRELDFSGHPIIAGCHVLAMEQRLSPGCHTIRMNLGPVQISLEDDGEGRWRIGFSIASPLRFDDYVPSAGQLADMLGLDEKELNTGQYPPMIVSCGNDYLLVPVKSSVALNRARFNEVKWTLSFVATLASEILLFSPNRSDDAVEFDLRLLGRGIAHSEDPPVASAVPAFAAYRFADSAPGTWCTVLQRGGGDRRRSILHAELVRSESGVESIRVSGHAITVGQGVIHAD